ncbi:transposase [Shewanella avicenniae]|uniref:Transposase n=1 Tax=Shewanella avicenniae TaxID=2814294 RepID=A0ABX7QT54_9GAMM|nr:transposase [Shewanella avicenniae]QSX34095.1 transposase [Shewanella avicenniae]
MIDVNIKTRALNDLSHGKLHFDVARQYGVPTKTLFAWSVEAEADIKQKGFAALVSSFRRLMSV